MTLSREIVACLKLGLPIMGTQLLTLSMVFVDNLMVGPLGEEALSGLAIASGFYSVAHILMVGVFGALNPLISQSHGSNNQKDIPLLIRQALLLGLVLSSALVAILLNAEAIFERLGQKAEVIPDAKSYLIALTWAIPCQFTYGVLRQLWESLGDSFPIFGISLLAVVLNVPLDYILIHGKLGLPAMGVAGAGYATSFLSAFMLVAILVLTSRHPKYRSLNLLAVSSKPDFLILKRILGLAFPLGGAIAAEMLFFVATTFLMGAIDAQTLAAHQVALNAASMVFMIPLGLSFAVSIRMATHEGRGDTAMVRKAWQAGLIIVLLIQSATASLFIGFPGEIVGLYSQKDEVRDLAISLIIVAGFFQFFDGLQVVGMGALRGLKLGRYALLATLFAFWVIGGSVVIYHYLNGRDAVGIWMGLLAGLGAASILHHGRVFFYRRRALG
jgi:multidrug resistance protein, MATE family